MYRRGANHDWRRIATGLAVAGLSVAPAWAQPVEPPPPAVPAPEQPPPAPAPTAEEAPVDSSASEVVEITSRAPPTAAETLQRSAEAVHVVDLRKARNQTADLGEVLARTQGVAVRREGGLGSLTRFSLDGLYGEQVRFFLDSVPAAIAGFPFAIADVPVNLIDRVEIYRGVVPIRFGADALGGAVNLVPTDLPGSHADASYQVGAFGTHRATAAARYGDPRTHLFGEATAFYDYTRNDYRVDVQSPDEQGRLHDLTVPRFHDGYSAYRVSLAGGVSDAPWAEHLSLRGFYTGYDKDLQSNAVMTVPYGGVTYGERVWGTSARYTQSLTRDLRIDVVASYAHRRINFLDTSEWVYDWLGQRILERQTAGELGDGPQDNVFIQHDLFDRALVSLALPGDHALRLSATPAYATRTGRDRSRTETQTRDPLSARHRRFSLVGGLEWELDALDRRLQNIAAAKAYVFHAGYDDMLTSGTFRSLGRDRTTFGGGDAFRMRATPWLYLKASYEYATRLPSPDELFGNGVLISPSLGLEPEVSHNANLGPRVELVDTPAGDFTLDANGFLRESQNLIVLLGNNTYLTYQNVYASRSIGVETEALWTSPGRWVTLDGTFTAQDLRNVSPQGTFGNFDGDRVPNRPWLFGSLGARGRIPTPALLEGVVEPFYAGRYVHSFLRGWESIGRAEFKQSVPSQLSHDAGVSYTLHPGPTQTVVTVEVDNVTGGKLYDSFGAQRPGRAFYLKLTADL
jgi:vitamin B12 transporter